MQIIVPCIQVRAPNDRVVRQHLTQPSLDLRVERLALWPLVGRVGGALDPAELGIDDARVVGALRRHLVGAGRQAVVGVGVRRPGVDRQVELPAGEEPTGAVADAVSFSVLVELMLAGLNVAVTPAGSPLIVWFAVPLKPFRGVKDIAVLADAPCVTLTLAGEAPKVKLGAAFTVRLMVTEVDDAPEVPSTLNVLVPTAALDATANVATLVVAVVAGLNEAVTPAGRPVAVSVTLPVKPVLALTVMVLVALAP